MRYKYKSHSDIPPYMKDYLLSVTGAESLEDESIEDLNNFLNGQDEWIKRYEMSTADEDYQDILIDSVTIH